MGNKTDAPRKYSFDIMRIVAICAVVMIHITGDYVKEFENHTLAFVCGNFLSCMSRFAVPMFFMISGALLLNENKKIDTKKMLHSAWSIFVLLIIWSVLFSLVYNIVRPILFGESISIKAVIASFFHGHYHLWYLFVLIGLYLITPILRMVLKRERIHLIGGYLIVAIIVRFCGSYINELVNTFTSTEDVVLDYISRYRLDYFNEYLVFYLLGWVVVNFEIKKTMRAVLYILGLGAVVGMFVQTQMFFDNSLSQNNYFYGNESPNVLLYSIAMFVFLQRGIDGCSLRPNRFWLKLSSLTFGVYLIHPVYLFVFKLFCQKIENVPIQIFVVFVCSVVASFVSVYIVSKLPLLKKLVRG